MIITSRQNALVRHVKRLGNERKYRYEHGEFLGAGSRCLKEAVTCGCDVTAVLAVADTVVPDGLLPESCAVTRVTEEILQYASPLKTANEYVFVCKMPETHVEIEPDKRYAVLDGVQDPGNVGTVIRSAAAFGMDGVLLVNNCADLYNPKTIRAAMGANFRVKVAETNVNALSEAVACGLTLYGASADGAVSVTEADLSHASVAIGGEGAGLSDAVLSLCAGKLAIPMVNGVESLNAAIAAGVLLWETFRKGLESRKL